MLRFERDIVKCINKFDFALDIDSISSLRLTANENNDIMIQINDSRFTIVAKNHLKFARELLDCLYAHQLIGKQSHIQSLVIELNANEVPKVSVSEFVLQLDTTIKDFS